MESDELQAIRAARAQQLKQESEAGQSSNGGNAQSGEGAERGGAEEMRRDILASLLEPTARERCLFTLFWGPVSFLI